jgi:hypothetical protein
MKLLKTYSQKVCGWWFLTAQTHTSRDNDAQACGLSHWSTRLLGAQAWLGGTGHLGMAAEAHERCRHIPPPNPS